MAEHRSRSACRRGYVTGGLVFALAVLVVWSGVLFAQVMQAHKVPVQTTQYRPLKRFPSAGFVVVSKMCAPGPPFAEHGGPAPPPLFDFPTVYGLEVDGAELNLLIRRPDPAGVLWRQHRFVAPHYGRQGNYTCSFTAGAFLTHKRIQCLRRTSKEAKWISVGGWQPCEFEQPFESLAGLMVGNWSTEGDAASGARPLRQSLPSWPTDSFLLIPAVEERLHATLDDVDAALAQAVQGAADYATALKLQDVLSVQFPNGVWMFQAENMDPFANIGPTIVTLHPSRCEGECDHKSSEESIKATLVKSPPMWRQPLCDSELRHVSSHQGCVPIVFRADMQEAVVVSTVAFRWPNLVAQWMSPIIVFALLFPALVLAPYCMLPEDRADDQEVEGLVGGTSAGAKIGRDMRFDDDDV